MSERFTNMIEDSDLEGTLARMSVCPDQNTGIGPKTEPNVLAGVNLDEMMLRIWAENTGQRVPLRHTTGLTRPPARCVITSVAIHATGHLESKTKIRLWAVFCFATVFFRVCTDLPRNYSHELFLEVGDGHVSQKS